MKTTAVIMGAGIAGAAAAKLLSKRFHRIVLVDKKFEPVPQSGHLHVLLARGQHLLREIFPEVFEEIAGSCPLINWGTDTYWRTPAGALPRRPLSTSTYLLSRTYLQKLLLDNLSRTGACELVEGTVREIRLSNDKRSVDALVLSDRELPCSICVDCMGRQSRTGNLLEAVFSRPVRREEVKTSLRYYSMMASRKNPSPYQQVYYQIDPRRETCGGVISTVENGRMIATFISIDPSLEVPGNPFNLIGDDIFQEFAQRIEFEPPCRTFGNLHNLLHHYEEYNDLPSNLFLIGDSVCQFNPVFGQGMTVAMEAAVSLNQFLEAGGARSSDFQKHLHKQVKFPWAISTMDPYNPQAKPGWSQKLTRTLLHRVMRNAGKSERVHQSLTDVLHMVADPRQLFTLRNLI